MILELRSFDYLTAPPERLLASAGFWAALPRLTTDRTARILMVADTLRAEDVRRGFEQVATPVHLLPPGVLAYRTDYEDFLGRVVRDVRYLRLYLVAESKFAEAQMVNVLSGFGVAAQPLDHPLPRPFARGLDRWDYIQAGDGSVWALLRTRDRQGGLLTPRSLHGLLGLDFPIWAALQVHTFAQSQALRLMRQKSILAATEPGKTLEDRAEASEAESGILGVRSALAQGWALHTVRLYVLVGAPDPEELNARVEVVRSSLPLETIRLFGAGEAVQRVFSAGPTGEREGFMVTTPGAALLAGSALSYRRRTETHGVLLGVDHHQAPVILDLFDDRHPSYNLVVLGQTGSGKTFGVLLLMLRHLLMGVRLVIVDPQGKIDLSFLGDEVYQRVRLGTAETRINVLDVVHPELSSQVSGAVAALRMLGVTDGDGVERALLDRALTMLYTPWGAQRTPTLVDLLAALRAHLVEVESPGMREALMRLIARLRPFVEGSLAAWFGGETTADFGLSHPVTVFDVSTLPQQEVGGDLREAMLSILVGNVHQAIRRLRAAGDTAPVLVFVDEMGMLMRDPVMAAYISREYKTARSRLVGMIVADQDLHSLLGPQDERGLHHGIPILANAANVLIFHQRGSELPRIREHFPDMPEEVVQALPALPVGVCFAQLPDDLLRVNVIPSALDRVVLSSREQDRAEARRVVTQLRAELGLDEEV